MKSVRYFRLPALFILPIIVLAINLFTTSSYVTADDVPPLDPHCTDVGPLPPPSDDWCGCVVGSVYVSGVPVSGAVVTLTFGQDSISYVTTDAYTTEPQFAMDGRLAGAVYGDEVTLTATHNSQTISRTYRALPDPATNRQQLNLVFPEAGGSSPTASIEGISFGMDSITLRGSGTASVGGATIVGYEWSTTQNGVIGTDAVATLPTSLLTQTQQIVSLKVQDNLGNWSDPVSQSLPLHKPLPLSTTPPLHAVDVMTETAVSITYNQPLDAASIPNNVFVHARQTHNFGFETAVQGNSITFEGERPFHPGERVQFTVTDNIEGMNGGTAVQSFVGQFVVDSRGGTANFNNHQEIDHTWTRGVITGDVDGDDDLDLVVLGRPWDTNTLWLNDGNATFTKVTQTFDVGGKDADFGDLNGDGTLDLFIAADGSDVNSIWFNDGSGSFTRSMQDLGTEYSIGVRLGDLDGDGDLDAFVVNYAPSPPIGEPNSVWLNDGNGNFTRTSQNLEDNFSLGVELGDVDNDGDLDAVIANGDNSPDQVWLNDGAASFSAGQAIGNDDSQDLALGDLDEDGDLDIFFANQQGQSNEVWLNNGRGIFSNSSQILGNFDSESVELGDLDGDGDLDAFVANEDHTKNPANRIWLNNGNAQFTLGHTFGSNHSIVMSRLGDLDGDGDLDAIVGNSEKTADDITPQPNMVWLNIDRETIGATEWLLLLYLAGDNNLDSFMARALDDLEAQGVDKEVRVIALLDGHGANDTQLFDIRSGNRIQLIPDEAWFNSEINSGQGETLTGFVQWATGEYTANYTYLTVANHGAGIRGVSWDGADYITPDEIATFADSLDTPIDILHFDACLMAMSELAYLFRDKVDYLVASQNLAWGIFAYDAYVTGMESRQPEAQAIYTAEAYAGLMGTSPYTISTLDLGRMDNLNTALQGLTSSLLANDYDSEMAAILASVQHFDSRNYYTINSDDEFIDLAHFAQLAQAEIDNSTVDTTAQAVIDTIGGSANQIVLYESHQSGAYGQNVWNLNQATGLSIYYPSAEDSPHYAELGSYPYSFLTESGWLALIERYVGVATLPPGDGDGTAAPTLVKYQIFLPSIQK